MSVRVQILSPILFAILLGFCLTGFVTWQAIDKNNEVVDVAKKALTGNRLSEELAAKFEKTNVFVDEVLSMTDFVSQEQIRNVYNSSVFSLKETLELMQEQTLSEDFTQKVSELMASKDEWLLSVKQLLGLEQTERVPTPEKLSRLRSKIDSLIADIAVLTEEGTDTALTSASDSMKATMYVAIGAAFVLAVFGSFIGFKMASGISKPLINLVRDAEQLASGDTSVAFDSAGRKDEIGAVGRAIEGFRDNVKDQSKLQNEAKIEQEKQAAKQKFVEDLIAKFNMESSSLLQSVESKMESMEDSAANLTVLTEAAADESEKASQASFEASKSTSRVAESAEEMASSISEISSEVENTLTIVDRANTTTEATNSEINNLAIAADEIGNISSLIQDIAEQTNLLALNATIEAARAGEYGKGFAVVAHEVKSLANQTAAATSEISDKISMIQSTSTNSVGAIKSITEIVQEVNESAANISAAIQQQGSSTSSISMNAKNASDGTMTVNENFEYVRDKVTQTSQTANKVEDLAKEANAETSKLKSIVKEFLENVAAA